MAKQEKSVYKKTGRPAGRRYREAIPVRLTEEAVAAIDAWAKRQAVKTRGEAIRRLIEAGLVALAPRKAKGKSAS